MFKLLGKGMVICSTYGFASQVAGVCPPIAPRCHTCRPGPMPFETIRSLEPARIPGQPCTPCIECRAALSNDKSQAAVAVRVGDVVKSRIEKAQPPHAGGEAKLWGHHHSHSSGLNFVFLGLVFPQRRRAGGGPCFSSEGVGLAPFRNLGATTPPNRGVE